MHPVINIALRAAREASDLIIQASDRLDRVKIYEKGENDFVTDIDHSVESLLISHIQKAYPSHSFLCEESGFIAGDDPNTVWVIDPIDGTRNFMRGLPHFCISMACIQNNKIQHAVIVDPIRREEFTATKGAGAQLNSSRMRVGSSLALESALVSLSCGPGEHYDKFIELQKKLTGKVAGLRVTGSAALDLAYVASGRLDAGWMSGLKKWDVAAGILLVREAGGLVSNLVGNPDCEDGDNFVFGNAKCFKHLLKTVA